MVEESLHTVDPSLGGHMTEIHKTLLAHEELVHILTDKDIHILMQGMQKYRKVELVTAATKTRSPKAKAVADDF